MSEVGDFVAVTVETCGQLAGPFFHGTRVALRAGDELVPGRVRASGIGFPYSLTVAIFGGTAPYLATWLASIGRPGLFPWYVAALALFGLVVYLRLPESAHRPLE